MGIDYRKRVTMPVRDMFNENMPIVFLVDVYGLTVEDLSKIPGGSEPMLAAVKRLGLDPHRYRANWTDLMFARRRTR
jgi:hypothetical protein